MKINTVLKKKNKLMQFFMPDMTMHYNG